MHLGIAIMFCFCLSFFTSNSAQGTLATPLAQISTHRNNFALHYPGISRTSELPALCKI